MHWFFIALVGPILYAAANHTDKYLISKYLKNGEVGSLIIFSSIFAIFALPIILFISPDIFKINLYEGIILAITGALVVVGILCYFYALRKEETSVVVPLYQTIPIFGFILGYFILGETISTRQIVASLIIVVGGLILAFEISVGGLKFKKEIVFLMLIASFFYALEGVIFKLIAINNGFWVSTFWGLVGKVILGFGFLFFVPAYRRQFFSVIKENKAGVIALNSINEVLVIVADAVTLYATLLAPVVLVLLVNSFQPLFIIIFGVLLTLFWPKIAQESLLKKHIIQKILGIGLITVGAYFIAT